MKPILTLTLLCGGVALAADFWQTKKPAEWSEKEARRIVENSPWVKETQPRMNGGEGMGGGRRGGGGGGMGGPGGGGMGEPGAGMGGGEMGGPGGGGMGGPGGGMQMPPVKVAFETAEPVGEAKDRIEVKDVFKGLRGEYVIVTVSGLRAMGNRERGKGTQEPMQKRLIEATMLRVKDDKVFQPADAKMQQTASGAVMIFAFARKDLNLTLEDKQVTFKTAMGPLEVSVKFNLKDMVYQERLSL